MILHLSDQLEIPLRERNALPARRRLRPRLPGARNELTADVRRERRDQRGAGRALALSRGRGRSALGAGGRQCGNRRAHRRIRGAPARATGQRVAALAASEGHGPAHRRISTSGASTSCIGWPIRRRRPAIRRCVSCTPNSPPIPGPAQRDSDAGRGCGDRGAAALPDPAWRALVLQHHDRLRHPARRHGGGTRDRGVLSGGSPPRRRS